MRLGNLDGRTDNGSRLHAGNLGIGNGQTKSSVTHHGVKFLETGNDILDLLYALALGISQLLDLFLGVGHELMKRGIQETDGHRIAFHSLIELLEIALLVRLDLLKSLLSLLDGVGADHLAEGSDSVLSEEHVLGTAETDTLGTQLTGLGRICGRIGIGANLQLAVLVSPGHYAAEVSADLSLLGSDITLVDLTGCTIERNVISLMEGLSAQGEYLGLLVDDNITAAGYTAGAHSAGNDSCM